LSCQGVGVVILGFRVWGVSWEGRIGRVETGGGEFRAKVENGVEGEGEEKEVWGRMAWESAQVANTAGDM